TLFQPDGCQKSALAYWSTGRNYQVADLHAGYGNGNDRRSFVDVTINGRNFRALLDSGATATLIDRRAAERAGIDLDESGVKAGPRIHGIGDKSDQTWIVPVDKFSVGTETIQHSQMLVMDGGIGDGSTDILLGVDFMLAHHIYIANSQKKMYFTYNGGRVFSLDTSSIGTNGPSAAAAKDAGDEPRAAADYALRGQARLARGELANARSDLDAAIRLDPNNANDYLIRARDLAASKQPDAALADLDKAIQLDPKNFDALLMRARMRQRIWQALRRTSRRRVRSRRPVRCSPLPSPNSTLPSDSRPRRCRCWTTGFACIATMRRSATHSTHAAGGVHWPISR